MRFVVARRYSSPGDRVHTYLPHRDTVCSAVYMYSGHTNHSSDHVPHPVGWASPSRFAHGAWYVAEHGTMLARRQSPALERALAEPCCIAFPCSSAFASSQHAGGCVACVDDSQAPPSETVHRALHRVALSTRPSPSSFYPPKRCVSIGCDAEVTHRASWVPRSVVAPYC